MTQGRARRGALSLSFAVVCAALGAGCATVRPWDKETLGEPCMEFGADGAAQPFTAHALITNEEAEAAKAAQGAAVAAAERRGLVFTAALGLLLLSPASALLNADSSLNTGLSAYVGSDGVKVISPEAGLQASLDDRDDLALHYGVDAVSAASWNYAKSKTHLADPLRMTGNCMLCHKGVDAISGASLGYRDTRQEVGVTWVRHIGETDLKPSYIRSQEDDYLSQTLGLGLTQYLFDRDTTLGLDYSHGDNQSNPVWNRDEFNELSTDSATLTMTQVLTRLTEVRVNAELTSMRGTMANPYSFIQVGQNTLQPVMENEPNSRTQAVAGGALKQSLGGGNSAEFDYRWYSDTWGVQAGTLRGEYDQTWGPITLTASWRHYTQTQAWFFQNFYSQAQTYMTRDLKLAAFNDDLYSVGLRGKLNGQWDVDLSYGYYLRHDRLNYSLYYSNGPVAANMTSLSFTLH